VPFPILDKAAKVRLGMLAAAIGFVSVVSQMSGAWAQPVVQSAQPDIFEDPRTAGLRGTQAAAQAAPADLDMPAPQAAAPDDPSNVINYGRPRPKKPKLFTPKSPLYNPDPRVAVPLPALKPYATAPGTQKRNSNPPQNPLTPPEQGANPAAPGPTVSVIPWTPPPPKPKPDPKPFDPLGVDVGSLRLLPFVELGTGYDTNPNRLSSAVKGSFYGRADGGLDVNSQWENNSLSATLRGGYSDYISYHEADRPDVQTKVDGRIDVLRDTQIDAEGRFTLDTQQPGSQQLAIAGSSFIVGRPLIETYGTSLGVTQRFDRLSVRLRGTFDRFEYENATLSTGSDLLLSENNYNDVALNGRVSYELTPGVIPYADVTGDKRLYDSLFDSSGYMRTSSGIAAKLGSTFEISRDILTGDLAAGYADRHYNDSRLQNAAGPTLDGSVIWTPSVLTKVTLATGTDFVETTLADASAAISRRVSLTLAHSFFSNFTLTGIGTFQVNNYVGQPATDHLYAGSLLAEYSLTRDVVLRATYRHERFISSQLDSNYSADVFLLGVRLQR